MQGAYKKKYNKLEIPGPWSSSNCYLFYDKYFESQIVAQKFCQDAFGNAYVGELAYGIGISKNHYIINLNGQEPRWKYLKSGTLDDIENSTCQCITNGNEYIGLKNDNLCPMPKKYHNYKYNLLQYHCSQRIYTIKTVCVLSEFANGYSYKLDVIDNYYDWEINQSFTRYFMMPNEDIFHYWDFENFNSF